MIGKMHKTQWVSSKGIEKVNIAYYDARQDDYTYIYKNIPTASGETYESEWIVSQVNLGENVFRIRVEDAYNSSIFDESDNYFSVVDEITCTDTDGGKDYYKKGKATGLYGNSNQKGWIFGEDSNKTSARYDESLDYSIYYDHCFDSATSNQLNEAYCDSKGILQAYTYICPNGCKNGVCVNLLRSIGDYKVYKIIKGKRLWIPTVAAFDAQGLKWEDIQDVANATEYPRLKLAKLANRSEVYYLNENGLKRHIPSANVFNSYNYKWEDIVEISSSELSGYPDSVLIRAKYKIYKLENGKKRWIKTAEAFNRLGYDWNEVSLVNTAELVHYPTGAPIE